MENPNPTTNPDTPKASDPVSEPSNAITGTVAPTQAARDLREKILGVFKTVYDPEIPVNIYELGMLYHLDVNEKNDVVTKMTLTTPACPVAGSLPLEVETKLRGIPNIGSVKLELIWEPPWNPQMMSEAAKLKLGFN